ncbi:hypothetical protein I2I11_01630 [Pontibacter sp. 172403-2]|uniref:hypothetical protein n=1 Tax=Pontibacter rufus TaxID=2791028 RepID=UPI0018AFA86F|nr:hypothetical protein [Pontibacter sp. 172403-2]MBF9251984.1 hypothetical protein [Pontibacter sp. 172403-2]
MKAYLAAMLLSFICLTAQAQQQKLMPAQVTKQGSISLPQPLVLVGDEKTAMGALILDPNLIESINVYKGAEATAKFGDKAKDGAVLIALKNNMQLARMEQVYTAFKVPAQQQNLPVAINDKLVGNPELLLANLEEIRKVEVKKQDVTAPARFSFDEDALYLNIVTKQPQP